MRRARWAVGLAAVGLAFVSTCACSTPRGGAPEPAVSRADAPPRLVPAYGGSMLSQPGHPLRTFAVDGEGGGMVARGYDGLTPVPGLWSSEDAGRTWRAMPEPKPR